MGQDGRYLTEQLTAKGVEVVGLSRAGLHCADGSLNQALRMDDKGFPGDIIANLRPDRIFYLAAFHHASEDAVCRDAEILHRSFAVHVSGLLNFLDALLIHHPSGRLFYAASSHVFGVPARTPQDEDTPMTACCPYGISKAAGVQICQLYRRRHNFFCSVGFLYNHESPRRKGSFLSRKIVKAAVAIYRRQLDELVLGDLDARVDWGYAPEYTDAMMRILELDRPNDFIIASGTLKSVRDFLTAVFEYVGLDWHDWVRVDPTLLKKNNKEGMLVGNPARLKSATGWSSSINLQSLAKMMVDAELGGTY
ncbi:MAG: GDP-mannose 4,6-dehydratase [Magnetococcus sp. THC-1_WYH]